MKNVKIEFEIGKYHIFVDGVEKEIEELDNEETAMVAIVSITSELRFNEEFNKHGKRIANILDKEIKKESNEG